MSKSTSPVKKSAAAQPTGVDGMQKPDQSAVRLARKSMGVPKTLPKNGTFTKAGGTLNPPTAKSSAAQPTGMGQPAAVAKSMSLNRKPRNS